ncbi:hypothetical protein SDC9_165019 [bioreactor metagenome]|uniref:Uncharacterized protein n=1 Tax=bioreactor metagenome TaxID=1076179 RepID=A0A645G0M6_9ZZZZ
MIWVIDLDHIVAVDVDFLHVRVVEVVGKDAKPGHVLIDSLDQLFPVKLLSGQLLNTIFQDQHFQGFGGFGIAKSGGKLR